MRWSAIVAIAACGSEPPAPIPVAPPTVAAPKLVPPKREPRSVPWRVDSVVAKRWTDRPTWTVRIHLTMTRLRDVASGTVLRAKLSCLVGGKHVADAQSVLLHGPTVGAPSNGFTDHFYWSPIAKDLIPNRCELLVVAQEPEAAGIDIIDREVGRHCIEPKTGELEVSSGKCAPLAEAPSPLREADRPLGSVPWRLDAVNPQRWTDRKNWAVRLHINVTRLREVPPGTKLKSKLSCQVGATPYVEIAGLGLPSGPISVGESAATGSDYFLHAKLAAPARCELLVYAQMPGARPDVIDHEVGRACFVPKGDDFTTMLGGCPPLAEMPR